MKLLSTALLFVVSFNAQAAGIKNTAVKETICQQIDSEYADKGAKKEKCLKGTFDVQKSFGDVLSGKKVTTVLHVAVRFEDKSFQVVLKKNVFVDPKGKIKLSTKWSQTSIGDVDLGKSHDLDAASEGDENVREVKSASGIKALPEGVRHWWHAAEQADFNLESLRFFKILDPKDKKTIIGYMAIENTSSEEADTRQSVTAKFDVNGNQIGDVSEESWGFNE